MNLNAMEEREVCPWGVERATGCAGWVWWRDGVRNMYDDLLRLTPPYVMNMFEVTLLYVMYLLGAL